MKQLISILKNNPQELLNFQKFKDVYPFWYELSQNNVDKNVCEHIVKVCMVSEKDDIFLLASFFHDIARPISKRKNGTKYVYSGHDILGAIIARSILEKMNCDKKIVDKICYLIMHHDDDINKVHDIDILKLIRYDVEGQNNLNHDKLKLIDNRMRELINEN